MLQLTAVPQQRQSIRSKIRPFPGGPPEKRVFLVGWTDIPQTFEQIMDALRHRLVNDLLYYKKMAREHIGDLVQQGWLRLWKALQENHNTLANLCLMKATSFVSNRCGTTAIKDHLRRYDSYHALSDWSNPDGDVYEEKISEIVIGSGVTFGNNSKGRHALFTHVVDRLIDIQAAMHKLAEWCGDDIRKLAALYYLTTSVSQTDAGRIAGFEVHTSGNKTRCNQIRYWVKIVTKQIKIIFNDYQPKQPNQNYWREQIQAGNLEPVKQLAEKYQEDSGKLLALYVLTTSVGRETIVKECGVNDSVLAYSTRQLRQELRWMYARGVRTMS